MKLVMRKALLREDDLRNNAKAHNENLEYFRKQILDHLDSIDDDKEEKAMQKAFSSMLRIEKGGKGLAVGTVREWKGKKFKKISPGKWRPVYEGETRGAKMAVSAIKRKIAAAKDAHEMMQIILENRDRFSDKNGQPLPIVQELSKYVAGEQGRREQAGKQQRKEKQDKKKAEKAETESRKFKASAEFLAAYKSGELSAGTAVYKMVIQGVSEKDAREAIGIPRDYDGSVDNWDRDQKRKAYNAVNPGDMYVDRSLENRKNFAVRVVNKNGNDGYKSATGGSGIERDIGGIIEFDTEKEAKKWIDDHSRNPKKETGKQKKIDDLKDRYGVKFTADITERMSDLDEKSEPKAKEQHMKYMELATKNTGGEKSDFEKIQDKYKNAATEQGDEDQVQVGKELISGKWKLVEADTPTASHDETNFHKTSGFPTTDDGATINDRDYGHDREAQEIVMEIGSDYDGRAVSVDNPVIVTKDGIVISGNNRTMSSKIAARKGTDKGYIEALKRKAKKFGFTVEQVDRFKHPRVIFETAENTSYSTDQFAKFNKSSKKAMSPIESAVKVSKTIKAETVEGIAGKMADFETLGELYADRNTVNDIFNALQRDNIISAMDRPQYVVDGGITGAGKEFLETVLIGSVINESNIRGLNREGCKSIRQKLVRAITPLIENKGMDGYSITKELNEAVDMAMQIATQKDKFKSIDDYTSQKNLFGIEDDPVAVEIARKLEGTQKGFAAFMQTMNGGLKHAANGEADIFLGGAESREDILGRMLNLKKAIGNVIDFFRNLRVGNGPRFVKKALSVKGENGEMIQAERWVPELAESPNADNATDLLGTDQKTIAIDFDGVINSFNTGWRGPTETDAPVEGAAEAINVLLAAGNKVVIYSTRAAMPEGSETIRRYLAENDVSVSDIEVTDKKPIAHIYIDDRAIPFSGDWSETLKQIGEFKPWTEKSLTWSGYPLQGRTKVHGMGISIENKKGSVRSGTDKDGHDWSIKMNFDYGYIRGTVGKDKDHVDCYIGPNPDAETVFIVHQNDPATGKYDEDKVMLGFDSDDEARKAYLSQYDRPGFLGDIDAMDIDTFKEKAFDPNNKGKRLT
jgi:hypothetical protein